MNPVTKLTPHTLRQRKGREPIVAITAYDAVMAHFAGAAGVDIILVGDSVGNTMLGLDGTVPVTLDMMVHHAAAVVRARPPVLIAADVPFGEAHFDFRRVLASCQRLMQEAGVDAVKIEGGRKLAPKIARLVEAGVPVWGHIGLMPQHVKQLGRYKKYGVTDAETAALVADAQALEAAGCFALLLEMVKPEAAKIVTESVGIPVIGIGAGADCDGQILVFTDVLGLTPGYVPGFVEKFADAGAVYRQGLADFSSAVRSRRYPASK
jgi:3-methyl-2-oxobutanoate hydroxymethyltransferase